MEVISLTPSDVPAVVVAVPVFSLTVKPALTFKEPDVPEIVAFLDDDPAKADMLSTMHRTAARTTERILFVIFIAKTPFEKLFRFLRSPQ